MWRSAHGTVGALLCVLPLGGAVAPNRPSVKKRPEEVKLQHKPVATLSSEICATAVSYKLTDALGPASVETPVQLLVNENIDESATSLHLGM